MKWTERAVGWTKSLGPYRSLLLLAVPLGIVEPLKLVAIFVAGNGHWFTGIFVEIGAYCASMLIIHRLFQVVKPKFLLLTWFDRLWTWFGDLRSRIWKPG